MKLGLKPVPVNFNLLTFITAKVRRESHEVPVPANKIAGHEENEHENDNQNADDDNQNADDDNQNADDDNKNAGDDNAGDFNDNDYLLVVSFVFLYVFSFFVFFNVFSECLH